VGVSPTCLKLSQQGSREPHVQTRQRAYEAEGIEGAGLVLSPEICIVVVIRISQQLMVKADVFDASEGSSPECEWKRQ